MGYGIVEQDGNQLVHIDSGTIKVIKKGITFSDRLVIIHQRLTEILREHKPTEGAVEGVFHAKNAQSALKLGHARGAAMLTMRLHDVSVAEYPPSRVKQSIVGHGRATKDQVQKMIAMLLGIPIPQKFDTSDALAIAITHLHCRKASL